ncbi:MAG: hypothetical protein ACYS0G_14910 [Planctomycetota bacterium]|jgi:hypothetical protein
MTDPRTDAIAREAARLIETGRAESISDAIRASADALGFSDADLPRPGRVRQHARALAMQALGDAGYAESVRSVWRAAERLMTLLSEAMPEVDLLLVGRTVQGYIDAGVTVHIRLYTEAPIGDVARTLVEFGYEEPTFETVNTRLGRLNRLRLIDDGMTLVVTRCLPAMARSARLDLFTGRPIKTATLADVRRKIEERD